MFKHYFKNIFVNDKLLELIKRLVERKVTIKISLVMKNNFHVVCILEELTITGIRQSSIINTLKR